MKTGEIGIAAFTVRGRRLAARIMEGMADSHTFFPYESGLKAWCGEQFALRRDGIIFIGACGIAVRTVAPFLKSKTTDPAVIVIDEAGQYVISLLSGHIGGANRLALEVARLIGACPVITTATDVNGKFAVDVFARDNQLQIESMAAAREISAAILREEKVGLYCEGKIRGQLPPELTLIEDPRALDGTQIRRLICITPRGRKGSAAELSGESGLSAETVLSLYPRPYVLGIGCRRGKSEEAILRTVQEMLQEAGISLEEVSCAASIDLKKEEAGLLAFCRNNGLSFETYPAERLSQLPGAFTASDFVGQVTGTDNVCERSALCLAGTGGRLIHGKYANNGVTAALAVRDWSVHFEK